jgi:pilus assembly protein CpaD
MKAATIVVLLGGLCLGACASERAVSDLESVTPTEQFAIEVQSEPVTLQLAPHRRGASRDQARALADFARQWSDASGGAIAIQTPARDGDPAAAYRTASDARDILLAQGVPPARVRIVSSGPDRAGSPVIVVTYAHYKAKGSDCGAAWDNMGVTGDNRPYGNFGCAVTANFAAQVADPADLMAPHDLDPPDATRRQWVIDNYRRGLPTASAKDEQANGAVSTAVH